MPSIDLYLKNFYKSGDDIWFERIYSHFIDKLYRYFLFRTTSREVAEDLAGDALVKIYKNLRNTKLNEKSFFVWMYKIAKNLLIDYYRKSDKDRGVDFENIKDGNLKDNNFFDISPFLKKELSFENDKLINSLNKLTRLQKDVLMLKFVEDLDYRTIAKIFGKRQNTIRGIVFRALSKLREDLI